MTSLESTRFALSDQLDSLRIDSDYGPIELTKEERKELTQWLRELLERRLAALEAQQQA